MTNTKTYTPSFVYNSNGLEYALFEEGRLIDNSGTFEYQYFLKDHLGNTRVTFSANDGLIKQQDHYYPFGMSFSGIANAQAASTENFYRYNGKELQKDLDLNWYDYGARMLDVQIGRWHTIDPLAEKMNSWSTFAYCFNNPIGFIDPNGKEGVKYTDENGQKTVESNVVVLLEQKVKIEDKWSDKKKARGQNKNFRIEKRNNARLADVKSRLNETYNGSDGTGSENSEGEMVKFQFNVVGLEVANTDGGSSREINAIATEYGLNTSSKTIFGTDIVAKAAVITTNQSTKGGLGLSNGVFVRERYDAPRRTLGHEIGHTLKLSDTPRPGYNSGLMDYSGGNSLISSEIDKIWKLAYDK